MSDDTTPTIAAAFRQMADEIERNQPERFGGAFVIVSPTGEVKDLLLLNRQQDLGMFWGNLKSTAEIAIAEIVEAERNSNTFGRR
jgi:hypothetical protein